jgi:hypothetical protein
MILQPMYLVAQQTQQTDVAVSQSFQMSPVPDLDAQLPHERIEIYH